MPFSRALFSLFHDPEMGKGMILISGPRQVGKTHLAKTWLKEKGNTELYFNWDDEKVRRFFRKDPHFFESAARSHGREVRIVFDEIHKQPQWKNLTKGYYDSFGEKFRFMVTGSARLELFHKSGDSMLGRYHLLHLNPLNPREAAGQKTGVCLSLMDDKLWEGKLEKKPLSQELFETLLHFSGFPHPYLKGSMRSLNLWHREYKTRLLREDMRDLTRIADLVRLEHFFELLPGRIGSPLSMNALSGDLYCSHDAVRAMVSAFEKLAITFRVRPYARRIQYSLKKEAKIYFFDWTLVPDDGPRFENFMAVQLKTWCDMMNDGGWGNLELHYLRTKMKKEVDFLIADKGKPLFMVEAKVDGNSAVASSLNHFSTFIGPIPCFCVVFLPGLFRKLGQNTWLVSANRFFNLLWK